MVGTSTEARLPSSTSERARALARIATRNDAAAVTVRPDTKKSGPKKAEVAATMPNVITPAITMKRVSVRPVAAIHQV